jgi:hypothetical protein
MYRLAAMATTRKTSNDRGERRLPAGFVPSPTAVICGRAKASSSSSGNQRLRQIVAKYAKPYSLAQNQKEKVSIVNAILDDTRNGGGDPESTYNVMGHFVLQGDYGFWYEVEEGRVREKIGGLLRECLHTQYRSSTKSKRMLANKMKQLLVSQKQQQEDAKYNTRPATATSGPTPLMNTNVDGYYSTWNNNGLLASCCRRGSITPRYWNKQEASPRMMAQPTSCLYSCGNGASFRDASLPTIHSPTPNKNGVTMAHQLVIPVPGLGMQEDRRERERLFEREETYLWYDSPDLDFSKIATASDIISAILDL